MTTERSTTSPFAGFAVLEIFGHSRYVGFVEEVDLFGSKFARVTIPAYADQPPEVRYFGAASIFAVTETTEERVRAELEEVARYRAPRPNLLGQGVRIDEYTAPDAWPEDEEADDRDGVAESFQGYGHPTAAEVDDARVEDRVGSSWSREDGVEV